MVHQVFNPGGNKTLLIDNCSNDIRRDRYADIANKFMIFDPTLEQVGFMEVGACHPFRLEMMGGELCVNALSCAGYWAFNMTGLRSHIIESAGADYKTELCDHDNVCLYFDKVPSYIALDEALFLVEMDGIVHFVQEGDLSPNEMRAVFCRIRQAYQSIIERFPAAAFIMVDGDILTPLVWVRDTDTEIFEHACGSGTIAACVTQGQQRYTQPSGDIISINYEGQGFYMESVVKPLDVVEFAHDDF